MPFEPAQWSMSDINSSRGHRFARWLHDSWVIQSLAAVSNVGIILAVVALYFDLSHRSEERLARHLQLLTAKSPGHGGKALALEYLVSRGVDLAYIDLSRKTMGGSVVIENASLRNANFSQANLRHVSFRNVDLTRGKV